MPAETRIVEIDDRQPVAVDQDVAGMHVGVDQAVARLLLGHSRQPLSQPPARVKQKVALCGRERAVLPERPPMRSVTHQAVGVEMVAYKVRRRLPCGGLVMHFGGDRTKLRKVVLDRVVVIRLAQHLGEQAAFRPARHAGEACLARRRDRHRHVFATVARGERPGHLDVGRGESTDPRALGFQLLQSVIARAVQAQDPCAAVAPISDPEGHVLGKGNERRSG